MQNAIFCYFLVFICLLFARGGGKSADLPLIDKTFIESVASCSDTQQEKCYRN